MSNYNKSSISLNMSKLLTDISTSVSFKDKAHLFALVFVSFSMS